MIHPIRIFLLFFSVVSILLALIFIFPDGEVKLSDEVAINFFPKEKLMEPGGKEAVDISEIIKAQPITVEEVPEVVVNQEVIDSLKVDPSEIVFVEQKIEYPEGDHEALNNFFASLDAVRLHDKHIRILHYGDSQVEGDRITGTIRQKFQDNNKFGGCGVGLVPIKEIIQGRSTLVQSSSSNWMKYSIFQKNPSKVPHKRFSLLGNFFRFTPYPFTVDSSLTHIKKGKVKDSLLDSDSPLIASADTGILPIAPALPESEPEEPKPFNFDELHHGWLSVSKSNMAPKRAREVQNFKILYTNNPNPVNLTVTINEDEVITDTLEPQKNFTAKEYKLNEPFKKIKVDFTGKQSPDIYGISLDCNSGISVDNIAMRGVSVTSFTDFDPVHLANMINELEVELVILQFGVNVVPNVIENYNYYERMMYRQLITLKQAAPNVSILVVGVSDMAMKEGLDYVSYPNIEKIRNAQKNAAFKAGCAFWDLYEAMGGKNSMISWVNNDPSYAEKDFTHFNHRGAQVIGKMIYDALMQEYYVYKKVLAE